MLPLDEYDVVVIGAGPAGSAAAATLAKAGVSVALVERDTFPRDKLCGEFLSGESRRILNVLGCLPQVLEVQPTTINAMRFISTSGAQVTAQLPACAFGISRRRLDTILFNYAANCGADVVQGADVVALHGSDNLVDPSAVVEIRKVGQPSEPPRGIRARLVLAAYGRFSHLDRAANRAFTQRQHPYVGFKLHHRELVPGIAGDLDSAGEVYTVHGGYCGICRVEDNRINVCMLLHKRQLKAGENSWPEIIARLSNQNLALARRMQMLQPFDEPVQTVAQVPFENKELHRGRVFYLGDAAGMIAPLCGDGQAMAMESGIVLGRLVATRTHQDIKTLARKWETEWHAMFDRRLRLGRLLQAAVLNHHISNAAISGLGWVPQGVVNALARATRG